MDVALEQLTRLAAQLCETPIAAIALLDEHQGAISSQIGWLPGEGDGAWSFCLPVIRERQAIVVRDISQDERFTSHPSLPDAKPIQGFAGAPAIAADGSVVGILFVMDSVARNLTPAQIDALQTLAGQILPLLELHRLQMPQPHHPPLPDFLDRTHDLVQTVDLCDHRLLYVNKSWLHHLGYSTAELPNLRLWDILAPESTETATRLLETLASGESVPTEELILLSKTGDRLWVEGYFSCQWEGAQPHCAIGIFRNITSEKETQFQYRQLFEKLSLGLFQLDLSGRYTQVNPALANIYGYDSPAEFVARVNHISGVYLNGDRWGQCQRQLQENGNSVAEVEVKRQDGSLLWVLETMRPLVDSRGQVIGYEGSVQDLTRSKQAEETVQMARNQLQAVLDAVPGTVSLISSDFHYLGVNRHLSATYNLPPGHFVGREVGFRQSKFGQFVREFFANQSEEASIEIDSEVNGAFRSDLVIAKKWLEDQAAVFVGIDITERKRAEAALQAELAEAAEYVRSLLPLPMNDAVTIDSRFIPSQQLGGDCFDYYWLDNDHLAIYLLDVSGHGSRAALLSVSVLNLLRSRFLPNTDFYQPCQVLTALNQAIQMERQRNMYFTIWYGVYNQCTRQLVYSCAGHPPAILISGHSPGTLHVEQLRNEICLPIGMFPTVEYSNASCSIDSWSTLYIFSDGIYEINTPDGNMWSLENFIQLLTDYHQNYSLSLEQVLQAVRQRSDRDTFNDDVSLLQVKFQT
ncbi:SpoIIE family protein phosphatase [Phormidium sp. CCY1219]|uniref:SpoIIE family protein phosphatase n=1 Tax=Phormidium sp. CCY1219 TaxID=2886104 RepID=UPI002D1EC29A|nr:SpoIIE family protein phosphatase [Phormidium sp. CCY1219]MEB3828017.1 SpoIIE family protein phosphatase [Phormidium sp. CCY1219]